MCAAVVCLILALAACDTRQYADPAADFASATDLVARQSKNAFQLVNDTVFREQVASLVASGDPNRFNPEKIQPFLSPADLKFRIELLEALQAYAAGLSGLIAQPRAAADTQAAALAASLQSLAKNERLRHSLRETGNVTDEQTNGVAAGLDAIAKFLINRKIGQRLPAILKDAEPKIESIATVLAKEIGDIPGSDHPGGLRDKLWRTYDSLLRDQLQLARQDQNLDDRRRDLAKLPDLAVEQRAADQALAATQSALKKLVSAHQALLEVGSNPAGFKVAVAAVVAEAQDVRTFYAGLSAK
jgi:hypothetical protein